MNNAAIGVFDSGVGGLTTVKALRELMPEEKIIYLGDTARLPYGTRSKETIARYAQEDIAFLLKHHVKMIIVACGTVSAVMLTNPIYNGELPFTGVLLPAAQAAISATRNGKIGVIGTPATISSGSYGKVIRSIRSDVKVVGKACPLFVPLVENGYIELHNPVTTLVAEEYLQVMKNEGVDTLILGCTHYPLLHDIIADIMGPSVTLISSGAEAGRYAVTVLSENGLLADSGSDGDIELYCTDSVKLFSENVSTFLGESFCGSISQCSLNP